MQYLWEKSEISRAASLTYRGFSTGQRIGELEIALRILQQEEALCLELGNNDSLQICYGNQALILKAWGRLEEGWRCTRNRKRSAWNWGTGAALLTATGLGAFSRANSVIAIRNMKSSLPRSLFSRI